MARRAHAYPQVEPGAEALVDARVVRLDRAANVAAALATARKRDAGALAHARGLVLRADLARAAALGLDALSASALARPVPTVDARTPEVRVRRILARGVPAVLVVKNGTPIGAIMTAPDAIAAPALAASLARRLGPTATDLISTVTALAARQRARAWLCGGIVRDLLAGGDVTRGDLDIAVEGDGHRLAREIADAVGGALVLHDRFLTASVEVPRLGTVDVITARSERYDRPGALPRVMPAGIRQDLERRDFTINAMAIELESSERRLVDPFGGRADLERRRLRVLHPLSFVEDPTRMFRGARYASRLGIAPDIWTSRCQRLALRLLPFGALSGARILAELDHILHDTRCADALQRLGVTGVFRVLDPRYRFTSVTARRVIALPSQFDWARASGIDARPLELTLLVILGDQPRPVADAALRRLGVSGDPRSRLERALAVGCSVPPALAGARTASARARLLRPLSAVALAWIRTTGDETTCRSLEEYTRRAARVTSALRGEDVIAFGVERGPDVARVLDALRDARIDEEVSDRDGEAEYVRRWVRTRKEG